MSLIRVTGPDFVAGMLVENGFVTKTAPRIKSLRRRRLHEALAIIEELEWSWEDVTDSGVELETG